MKVLFRFTLIITTWLGTVDCYSQTILQHTGANDPLDEGFFVIDSGSEQVGPVFNDQGFDAWSINTLNSNDTPTYRYDLLPNEQQAATENGWEFSVRMRFVELGFASLRFQTGTRNYWVALGLNESGDITVWDGGLVYTFEGGGSDYQEYSVLFDSIDQTASLWIAGVGQVADLSGGFSTEEQAFFVGFGVGHQIRSHVHWNEATLAIIPEPTSYSILLSGAVILTVLFVRRRG